jgi:hypothetical protein
VSRSATSSTSSVPTTPTNMISPMIEDAGASTGSTPGGSAPRTAESFAATTWRAARGSTCQSNSTQMSEMPMADDERRRRTPAAPLSVCSSGTVTSCSTSSGARPLASVTTVTEGADSSGSTSSGICEARYAPSTTSSTAAASTHARWRSEA